MALTYATVEQFKRMKDVDKSQGGIIVGGPSAADEAKIFEYLQRATRWIDRYTRRFFFPRVEARRYPIPYQYNDLAMRRYPTAHLKLGMDLLEPLTVNNGVEDVDEAYYYALEHNIYPKNILVVRYPKYWGGGFGGIAPFKRFDEPSVTITGVWGFADYGYPYDWWVDTYDSVQDNPLSASATTITVTAAGDADAFGRARFLKGDLIRIENELIEVTAVASATSLTVVRGIRGSTAVAHVQGTDITRWRVAEDIVEACLQATKTWREADIAAGSRIGVSEVSAGAELGIPGDALEIIKSYQRSVLFDK